MEACAARTGVDGVAALQLQLASGRVEVVEEVEEVVEEVVEEAVEEVVEEVVVVVNSGCQCERSAGCGGSVQVSAAAS